MKLPPALVAFALSLASSCSHTSRPAEGAVFDVRCELVALDPPLEGQALARFRLVNDGGLPLAYSGYAPDGPLFESEVFEGGTWRANPIGWCGTGLSQYTLDPGKSLEFAASIPCDGRSYRFEVGQPVVRTPEVSAPAQEESR